MELEDHRSDSMQLYDHKLVSQTHTHTHKHISIYTSARVEDVCLRIQKGGKRGGVYNWLARCHYLLIGVERGGINAFSLWNFGCENFLSNYL